ncbi:MAG: methyl-accepting chemotaxis protein [Parachlamydia sp.]|nr:MAG: methyl-accepting chemotaxis protein [Parachlamydia sp.]
MVSFILSFICAIMLVAMLILAQMRILEHLKPQIQGTKIALELNQLAQQIAQHQDTSAVNIALPESKQIQEQISSSIFSIKNFLMSHPHLKFLQMQKISSDLEQMDALWLNILEPNAFPDRDKQNILKDELLKKMMLTIEDVYDWSGLYTTQDFSTHFLVEGALENLNLIQLILSELLLMNHRSATHVPIEEQAAFLSLKEELITYLQKMQEGIDKSQINNELILQKLNSSSWKTTWSTFKTTLDDYLQQMNYPPQAAPLTALLNQSLMLNQQNLEVVKSILETQLSTVQKRQALGTLWTVVGLSLVLAFYATRVIRRPIADLKNAAKELAAGNISIRVFTSNKDEVSAMADAFNEMANYFENVITGAKQIAKRIVNSAMRVNTISKDLETHITTQKDTVSLILPHAKRISQSASNFALSLNDVSRVVALTSNLAISGLKDLNEMKMIMQQMEQGSFNIVQKLSELQLMVDQINGIINTIAKIADQANLLSLNAAIRANKTGPTGLGFSVIAKKIRELADQAAFFTLDIEKSIHQIIAEIALTELFVKEFSAQILAQVNGVTETSNQLTQLIENTQNQTQAFDLVNQGMQKQADRAAQIHGEIYTLTNAVQATTQTVNKFYKEIQYLDYTTSHLETMTNKFISSKISPE